jgi:sugar/nucleoside kinase (ribokinase family)
VSRRVVVVGDAMLDVVARPLAPLAPTSDTPSRIGVGRGGSGANIAVGLAGAGHAVSYVAAVGDDVAGRYFRDELAANLIDARLATVDASTGVVVSIVDGDGQRSMMSDRGANSLLSRSHVAASLEAPFEHLHVSGYTLLDAATRDVASAALARARELGATSSLDVCSVGPLTRVGAAVFLAAGAGASYLFANEEEARALAGVDDVASALSVLGGRYPEVVVTRGPLGAMAMRDERTWWAPARAAAAFDSTGAGDAATGAYLGARLEGRDVEAALNEAMDAAALVVRGLGARQS